MGGGVLLYYKHRAAEAMEPDFSDASGDHNFEFAFNSSHFSDRVLRIEILAGLPESKSDGEGYTSIADWACHRKRRREETKNDKATGFSVYNSEHILNSIQLDMEDGVEYENHDGKAVVMIEKSPSVDEPSQSSYTSWSMNCYPLLRVKSVFISSAILAAKSPFFYKIFSNGMRESDQRHATLRINASEEIQI